MKKFLPISTFALLVAVSNNHAFANYVHPDTKLCNQIGCSMSLEEFAERMSFSSGTDFRFSNNRDSLCKEKKGLLGYYRPSTHEITMCNENAKSAQEIANTIAHETIHAGQACLNSYVPFNKGVLSQREQIMVQRLYPPSEWEIEYNARAISNYLVGAIRESDHLASVIDDACSVVNTKNLPRNSSIRALHR
uniref:hypothetical protein n=1 Tax=Synechococcus sp. UW106 TaxID=368495 RepID=UPI0010BD350F|nr:hypothetical protein [Synechococcus sp. UW106]